MTKLHWQDFQKLHYVENSNTVHYEPFQDPQCMQIQILLSSGQSIFGLRVITTKLLVVQKFRIILVSVHQYNSVYLMLSCVICDDI